MEIKPGCLCIMRNTYTGIDGQCVRVVRAHGEMTFNIPNRGPERHFAWEIDRKLTSTSGKRHNRAPEFQLLRIDGDPDQTAETERDKLVEVYGY